MNEEMDFHSNTNYKTRTTLYEIQILPLYTFNIDVIRYYGKVTQVFGCRGIKTCLNWVSKLSCNRCMGIYTWAIKIFIFT